MAHIQMRVSDALKARIRKAADKQKQGMTAYILEAVKEKLEKEDN